MLLLLVALVPLWNNASALGDLVSEYGIALAQASEADPGCGAGGKVCRFPSSVTGSLLSRSTTCPDAPFCPNRPSDRFPLPEAGIEIWAHQHLNASFQGRITFELWPTFFDQVPDTLASSGRNRVRCLPAHTTSLHLALSGLGALGLAQLARSGRQVQIDSLLTQLQTSSVCEWQDPAEMALIKSHCLNHFASVELRSSHAGTQPHPTTDRRGKDLPASSLQLSQCQHLIDARRAPPSFLSLS